MRKIIEYTLVSVDGVFAGPRTSEFMSYRDDAYIRDGLGQLSACDAMLMGRTTYQGFAQLWPGRDHPWADRLNAMKKYVFSSTLDQVDWNNAELVKGDVPTEVTKLKQQAGGDLLVYGHGLLGETLLRHGLLDAIDISIHPIVLGSGRLLFRDDQAARLNLVATKTFSQIIKLTYEPTPR